MIDQSKYTEEKPFFIKRVIWKIVNITIFRFLFSPFFRKSRNIILRFFGAKISQNAEIYSSVSIFAPWNLEVGEHSCVGPDVELYCKDYIVIERNVTISQGSFICTASHNIQSHNFPLRTSPIKIKDGSWIAARAIVLPNVTIGVGAVCAAGSVVFQDVEEWSVVQGNPATKIKIRSLK